jgi:hypothetical protein
VLNYAIKTYGGVDTEIHIFLTSALVGGEWSALRLGHFTPEERAPGTHWIGGWVDPRVNLDDLKKRKFLTLPGLEMRLLGCPARSQSLYRLCYPGSIKHNYSIIYKYCFLKDIQNKFEWNFWGKKVAIIIHERNRLLVSTEVKTAWMGWGKRRQTSERIACLRPVIQIEASQFWSRVLPTLLWALVLSIIILPESFTLTAKWLWICVYFFPRPMIWIHLYNSGTCVRNSCLRSRSLGLYRAWAINIPSNLLATKSKTNESGYNPRQEGHAPCGWIHLQATVYLLLPA